MQYVWQHRLWPTAELRTVDGRRLQVIDPGQLNTGAGPDFFNAKIELDGEKWVGNVEIHDRASDWRRHGHDNDPAYDTVILHVVNRDDTMVRRPSGGVIPQVLMPDATLIRDRYARLTNSFPSDLPCEKTIAQLPSILVTDWITALGMERLYAKSERVAETVERLDGDWEGAAYVTLARALGFGVNNDAFERLAMSLPLKVLRKHNDNPEAMEALLFGQANLLDSTEPADPYPQRLRAEYEFLAHKYDLKPLDRAAWKLGRMRPWNFPHRRIATLARFLSDHYGLKADLVAIESEEDAKAIFSFDLDGYWTNHHRFGSPGDYAPTAISTNSLRLLLINVVVPLIHAWGTAMDNADLTTRAIALLEELPPESNSITTRFRGVGVKCPDAYSSQALIQLRRAYCEPRKCMYCRFGRLHIAEGR